MRSVAADLHRAVRQRRDERDARARAEALGEIIEARQAQERRKWLRSQPAAARTARGVEGVEDLTESGWEAAQCYWVSAIRGERGLASPYGWIFGYGEQSKPPQMPNLTMEWRRPTYAEALLRERKWAKDPVEFLDREEAAASHGRRGVYR